MPKNHSYVLGINAYDHDVSACLLRDGEIAYAIEKERITRKKHAGGFFQEVVDYCLQAEGITLDDVDLVVRNCYVLPVDELEVRMIYQGDMPDRERAQTSKSPLYLSKSNKVVTVSHHLAHAYSAFAVCPFDEGVVMVVDGVGSYSSDIKEPGQLTEGVNPLARESESYYRFKGSKLETLKKVWLQPCRGLLSDEFFNMDGLGALYSRVSSYIFADWNKCGEVMGLAPYGRPNNFRPLLEMKGRRAARSRVGRGVQRAVDAGRRQEVGSKSVDAALGRHGLARSARRRGSAARARALAARDDRRQESVPRRRRGAQLRRQRTHRARGGIRQCLDPAGGGRQRHLDRLRLLRPSGAAEEAARHS